MRRCKDNVLLFTNAGKARKHYGGAIGCNERLGGLSKILSSRSSMSFLTTRAAFVWNTQHYPGWNDIGAHFSSIDKP